MSIKSNPFVLLSGQSGIGKSTLPVLFSEYLSYKEKRKEIILNSTNSLGRSFSNKEWHLKRDVISEILPILPFEGKECSFTVNDSFKSVGMFKIDPRFKFNDKRLINHLIKLHEEDPNQDVDLKIKVSENIIDSLYLKIHDFKNEWDLFKKLNDDNDNISSNFTKFLDNSKNEDYNHFLIIENITNNDENSLISFFNYLKYEFDISEYNNLFIVCLVNIDDFNVNFSNSFIDWVTVIELNVDLSKYLRDSINEIPVFKDIHYLEYHSEDILKLSISELKSIFQEIWCDDSDLWSLISQELINLNDIFIKEGFNISFRTIVDILRFLLVSWKYEGKKHNWKNWEKYFDVQIKQKLLPKITKVPKNPDFFNDLSKFCFKIDNGEIAPGNIKYSCSYLKIKNMEFSLNLDNFSFFNSYTFLNQISDIKIKKSSGDKKTADNNMSKYGSNIYKYGDYYIINKQINRKHINFGKFNSLEDATFVKNILIENEWVLSRIKNNDCIYKNGDCYWIIKSFKNKLHILGKFRSYEDAIEHVGWLTDEFKNNENFEMYISPSIKPSFSKNLDEITDGLKGWMKLVFNAINEIESNVFSLEDLKGLDIFKMYQFEDESLESTIIENLNKLSDLKLIIILSNNYYKKVF